MSLPGLATVLAVALLALLALLQVALAAGAPLGRFAWGGQHTVLPRRLRIGSALSVLLYALFAVVIADRAGAVDVLPDPVSRVGIWVLAAYFTLGILLNAASRSVPERWTMAPVCTVLAAACVVVALGGS